MSFTSVSSVSSAVNSFSDVNPSSTVNTSLTVSSSSAVNSSLTVNSSATINSSSAVNCNFEIKFSLKKAEREFGLFKALLEKKIEEKKRFEDFYQKKKAHVSFLILQFKLHGFTLSITFFYVYLKINVGFFVLVRYVEVPS